MVGFPIKEARPPKQFPSQGRKGVSRVKEFRFSWVKGGALAFSNAKKPFRVRGNLASGRGNVAGSARYKLPEKMLTAIEAGSPRYFSVIFCAGV
jgi:hypothetical protein